MDDLDFNFVLQDRIAKIKAINEQYDLENNSTISFSGGKDSVVLSHLIDLALPNNKIPRVYANTGIEYNLMVKFVKNLALNDDRFIIINQDKNIKKTLDVYGYPFKSKEHSLRVNQFNNGSCASYLNLYINGIRRDGSIQNDRRYMCPDVLKYQFNVVGQYNFSNKCCYLLKKNLLHNVQNSLGRSIFLTGMRRSEGGNRSKLNCVITKNDKLLKFHPLVICSDEWEEYFIKFFKVKLCELYYPPYNFKRTGCKGCPFNLHLQDDLLTMKKLLPNEYKQCLYLWKPVYNEYVRLGYRLSKDFYKINPQFNIFDYGC